MACVIMINFLGYAYGTKGVESVAQKFAALSWEHLAYFGFVLTLLSCTAHIGFELERCGWTNTPPHKAKAKFDLRAWAFFGSAVGFAGFVFHVWFPMMWSAVFGDSLAM